MAVWGKVPYPMAATHLPQPGWEPLPPEGKAVGFIAHTLGPGWS